MHQSFSASWTKYLILYPCNKFTDTQKKKKKKKKNIRQLLLKGKIKSGIIFLKTVGENALFIIASIWWLKLNEVCIVLVPRNNITYS